MPLFEVDPERPVLVQPDEGVTLSTTAQRVVDGQIDALLGERIFPIAEGRSSADPHLLAIDATGSPVVIEVVANLDDAALQRALKHAGAAGRLTRHELAGKYSGGAEAFVPDLDAFFDGLPYGAGGGATPGTGARLVVICSAARDDVLDAVDFIRQPGARASVLRVAVVHAEDGRRYVDVSPLAVERATVDPALVTIDAPAARDEIPVRQHSQSPVRSQAPTRSRRAARAEAAPAVPSDPARVEPVREPEQVREPEPTRVEREPVRWSPAVTVSDAVPTVAPGPAVAPDPEPTPRAVVPVSAPVRMTRAAARAAAQALESPDLAVPTAAEPAPDPASTASPASAAAPTRRSRREPSGAVPTRRSAREAASDLPTYESAPSYDAPERTPPTNAQPTYTPPTYATPAYAPPTPPRGTRSYDRTGDGLPSYPTSRYDAPGRETPSYERSSYEKPADEKPAYEAPSRQAPTYEPLSYEQPRYDTPSYERPSYERGSYDRSSYDAPDAYAPPVYDAPPRAAGYEPSPLSAAFPTPDFDEDDPDLASLARSIGGPSYLVWTRPRRGERFEATLLTDGTIELSDGTRYRSPDSAAAAASGTYTADGWSVWRFGDNGPSLTDEFRARFA